MTDKELREMKLIFSRNLSRLLFENNLSQKELAKICGVSTSTVSSWIKLVSFPRIDKVEIIAQYFGVNKSDLLEDGQIKDLSVAKRQLIDLIPSLSEQEVEAFKMLAKAVLDKRGQ